MAGRYHGMELDPERVPRRAGETVAVGGGAVHLGAEYRHVVARACGCAGAICCASSDTGPVVLLFNDGTAGLLTGANAEHKVVFVKDPTRRRQPIRRSRSTSCGWPRSGPARPSCCAPSRGYVEADAPFTLRWLVGLVLQERRSLRDIGLASLTHQLSDHLPAAPRHDDGQQGAAVPQLLDAGPDRA